MDSDSKDISKIIQGWEYVPDEVIVRFVEGDDNRKLVQMRLELGLLQMEINGRPDGKRPYGFESLLEYFEHQLEQHIAENGSDEGFFLDPDECDALHTEATQYYYRYLSLFHLKDYQGVVRDTARNLRAFDFIYQYAEDEEDQFMLEQYRPYVIMMNARSFAHIALENGELETALKKVDEAIDNIEDFFTEFDQNEMADNCGEVLFLREFRQEIRKRWLEDPMFELRIRMKEAVEREDYETAAQLRDEIKRLKPDED